MLICCCLWCEHGQENYPVSGKWNVGEPRQRGSSERLWERRCRPLRSSEDEAGASKSSWLSGGHGSGPERQSKQSLMGKVSPNRSLQPHRMSTRPRGATEERLSQRRRPSEGPLEAGIADGPDPMRLPMLSACTARPGVSCACSPGKDCLCLRTCSMRALPCPPSRSQVRRSKADFACSSDTLPDHLLPSSLKTLSLKTTTTTNKQKMTLFLRKTGPTLTPVL